MLEKRADRMGQSRARSLVVVLIAAAAGVLAACSDDAAPPSQSSGSSQQAAHKVKWLELSSAITPAQWLVSRSEDRLRDVNDPEVKRVTAQLEAANALYRESERMIANRAAQLSEMLATHGIEEASTTVLDDLTAIAGEAGQTEGFGAVTQHYFNLRASNVAREEALAALKSRYGRRSASRSP
jgi:hypothetical protein